MEAHERDPSARSLLLRAAREELVAEGHAGVSMRAVARRAGLSHASPAHFFGDRAGMMTAVAVSGFEDLERTLLAAGMGAPSDPTTRLEAIGRAYVGFGLSEPALMDLMFRRSELSPEDSLLIDSQKRALAILEGAVEDLPGALPSSWSLVSWSFVHGLVSLIREGVLARIAGVDPNQVPDLAVALVKVFASGLEEIAE